MLANHSHVRNEFTNTKKLGRIGASSFCRQQFANVFADCICAVRVWTIGKHVLLTVNQSKHVLYSRDLHSLFYVSATALSQPCCKLPHVVIWREFDVWRYEFANSLKFANASLPT